MCKQLCWLWVVPLVCACAAQPPAPVDERGAVAVAGQAVIAARTAVLPPEPATVGARATEGETQVTVHALPEPSLDKHALGDEPPSGANAVDPAVIALLNTANQQAAGGEHDLAAATVERAVSISPGDAWLWHRLALARLEQGRPDEAAHLAAKSNSLAAGEPSLQASNWRLIARARTGTGDDSGARAALAKADGLNSL